MLSELIFDCVSGLFPCSPIDYALLHTGNLGGTLAIPAKEALAKE